MPLAPTATAEPALVGPVLVYTEVTPLDERRGHIDMFVVAYDVGAKREIRRTTLSAFWQITLLSHGELLLYPQGPDMGGVDLLDPVTGARRHAYESTEPRASSSALSPDGKQLAFTEVEDTSEALGPSTIRVLDLETGDVRTLASFTGDEMDPFFGIPTPRIWRDDGRGILVSGDTGSGRPGTWATVWLDGAVTVHLRETFAFPSPNGRTLVLQEVNGSSCFELQRLRIHRLDDDTEIVAGQEPGRGIVTREWSPDGYELLYMQYNGTIEPDARYLSAHLCLPTYDLASGRAFVASARDGGVREIADIDALLRQWHGGRLISFTCTDGAPLDVYQSCPVNVARNLFLDGEFVGSGDNVRVLGIIEQSQPGR